MFQAEREYTGRPCLLQVHSHGTSGRGTHTVPLLRLSYCPLMPPHLLQQMPLSENWNGHQCLQHCMCIKYILFLSQVDLLSSPALSPVSVKENPRSSLLAFLNPAYLSPTLAPPESCLISILGVSGMSSTRWVFWASCCLLGWVYNLHVSSSMLLSCCIITAIKHLK